MVSGLLPARVGRGVPALALLPALLGLTPGHSLDPGGEPFGSMKGPDSIFPDTLRPAPGGGGQGMADFRWRLKEVGAAPTSLEAFRGRVLFINMWATWCGPCVRELAGIQALMESLEPEGGDVSFLLVSPEEPERVEAFLRVQGYDIPVYLEIQEMPEAFGLEALPTTWIVDSRGRIVLKHRGAADWNQPEVRDFLLGLQPKGG